MLLRIKANKSMFLSPNGLEQIPIERGEVKFLEYRHGISSWMQCRMEEGALEVAEATPLDRLTLRLNRESV